MASATRPSSVSVYRGRIAEIVRQPEAIDCLLAKRGTIRLPLLLASYIAISRRKPRHFLHISTV